MKITNKMKTELRRALEIKLLAMADDELILGHRDSEWCGHAPILEEDIAFANIALDEIGHAILWYGLLADLVGQDHDTYPDVLVYQREPASFRNVQLVDLPNADWAFTVLRQYLFDVAEAVSLEGLAMSDYPPLTEVAVKIQKEELYHRRHSANWVLRLGKGTEESRRRMQAALDELWMYALQLFNPLPGENHLVDAGFVADVSEIRIKWEKEVLKHLADSGLRVPDDDTPIARNRDQHSEYLEAVIQELQSVARSDPTAAW